MTYLLPGEPRPKKNPYANQDTQYEEAKAARKRNRERDKRLSWERAVKQVSVWTPSMAVEALTAMPAALQQMYLLAEEQTHNRQEVLRFFPAVAPSTRRTWAGLATPKAEAEKPTRAPRQQRKTST
jgi:hypothetical protein